MEAPSNLAIILAVPEPLNPAEEVDHESVPEPSVVKTCPLVPSVFGIVIAPAVIVPAVSTFVTLLFPSFILFDALTDAFAPIAVALVRLFELKSAL